MTVLVALLAIVLTGTGPAAAEPPFAVQDLLTDRVGALGTEAAEVQQTLEAVRDETGGALHVVLVDGFDQADADWAEEVATQSDLGSSYLLFTMAVDDSQYQWWLGDTFPWDVDQVDQLVTSAAQPEVLNGNWSVAVTALAVGLRTGEVPDAPDGTGVSSWTGTTTTAVIGGAALVLLAAHQLSRRSGPRRVQGPDAEPQSQTQ